MITRKSADWQISLEMEKQSQCLMSMCFSQTFYIYVLKILQKCRRKHKPLRKIVDQHISWNITMQKYNWNNASSWVVGLQLPVQKNIRSLKPRRKCLKCLDTLWLGKFCSSLSSITQLFLLVFEQSYVKELQVRWLW